MTKRICWHLIQNCNTRKVNRNLCTACGLRSFYRPSVLCDRAFVCHVDDAADCTAVLPSTGAGAVRAGRGLNCCWFFWIARKPNYSLRVIKKANCTLTAGCCPLKMHMDHQDHHRHIYSHFSKYINEHIITNTGGRLPEKPSGSLDWSPIVSLHYTIIHY